MAVIINLSATTEAEAINSMLASIGEAPLSGSAYSTSSEPQVLMAVDILTDVVREVQLMGWKFNTEFGLQIEPTTTLSWPDNDGVTTTLNIFKPPAQLAAFEITKSSNQQGSRYADAIIRKSKVYEEAAAKVFVFYDRALNRDGFKATDYPYLYIDPVWWFNFEDMPESARRYCTVKAARMFAQRVNDGDGAISRFTQQDETYALRILKREQGQPDDFNIFNNIGVASKLGGHRRLGATGVYEDRDSPGHT
jgi:hypothetical protein